MSTEAIFDYTHTLYLINTYLYWSEGEAGRAITLYLKTVIELDKYTSIMIDTHTITYQRYFHGVY